MTVRAKVCVLGSANMDLVVQVARAPALGETVSGHAFEQVVGGKGVNQALAAARAGADVTMLGAVGDDAHGAAVRRLLASQGVDVDGLGIVEVRTGTAHITVDGHGRNSIVVVPGANGAVGGLTERRRAAIEAADVLLLQLELPIEVVVEAALHARTVGTRVVLTPAPVVPVPDQLLGALDLLVPNEHEAALLTATDSAAESARALVSRGVDAAAVTRGEEGVYYLDQHGELAVPARRVPVIDTTGAGDTFVGCLAVAVAEGRPMPEALRWATTAAALSVQRFGASTSMPERDRIDDADLTRALDQPEERDPDD
ncbi:MAG TPA: ribokinase [Nocardioidaceae bacterium]|nr:ribokinase [Nocardioidaceae bacterium]